VSASERAEEKEKIVYFFSPQSHKDTKAIIGFPLLSALVSLWFNRKKLRTVILLLVSLITVSATAQQKTIAQIKKELEQSPNPPLYVKDVLKKKFILDTIAIPRTSGFAGLPDSLAYHGKIKKVYGPYDNGRVLVQVLAKLPNTFNRVGQIFIDTTVFTRRKADSLANDIITRIKSGEASFEDMAVLWSMGGESFTKGDLGWIASGALIPEIERELRRHKKGEIFKVWTKSGLHIIRKTSEPKQDTGFALMMRILMK
jgi:PPIC-type PPIASE domain